MPNDIINLNDIKIQDKKQSLKQIKPVPRSIDGSASKNGKNSDSENDPAEVDSD